MEKHIDLLGRLHIIGGGLSLMVALSLALLALGAFSLSWSLPGDNAVLASRVTAGTFLAVAVASFLWGWANLWVGQALRRTRPAARIGAMIVAVVNLFVLPFGTALSVYSLWVMLHNETRHLLDPQVGAARVS